MANTYHQIYVQTVFATKYRNSSIAKHWKSELFGVIGKLINDTGCKTLIVNGVEDHVHCLISVKPTICVSDLMQEVKAKSSKYVNQNSLSNDRFEWQKGFGVFSYGRSQLDMIYKYIQNQEVHHNKQSFKDEYLSLLKAFEIDFDETYIFHDPV